MDVKEELVWQVWAKGYLTGNDPLLWRKDECGAWIFRGDYERRNSEYGWQIEHIKPESDGGTADISNLRPLHWQNTTRRSDGSLDCAVTSLGSGNVQTEQQMDSHTKNRLAAVTCLELVLMRKGNANYLLVVARLGSKYNCSIIDCFAHPEYLRTVLREIYKDDCPQIIDEVRVQLDELAEVDEISEFLEKLADGSATDS